MGPTERIDARSEQDRREQEHVVREHVLRYACALPYCVGRRVLDVACGTGYGSALLLAGGASEVIGVDQLPADAVRGPSWYVQANLDALAEPLPWGPVDVAVCFETIEHVGDPDVLLAALVRSAGTVIFSVPLGERMGENPFHRHCFTWNSLAELAARHCRGGRMAYLHQLPGGQLVIAPESPPLRGTGVLCWVRP